MKIYISFLLLFLTGLGVVSAQGPKYDLTFRPEKYTRQTVQVGGETLTVRAYENVVYVEHPLDTSLQKLNIYVPEAYFEGKAVHGYTAATAPIFFPNRVGGYAPAQPANLRPGPRDGGKPSAVLVALANGYVVASAGARGRTTQDQAHVYIGKAPAALVDLKAAIRYLKFNDKNMPGDAAKIISNGTSAGGAMSTLLGATGNSNDYASYLETLGAADATDDIFAVSAYCPIINLDHADMAYEWQFAGIHTYKRRGPPDANKPAAESELTAGQIDVSNELKVLFPAYLNQLKLKNEQGQLLTLDANGEGTFKELVKSYVVASAQRAFDRGVDMSPFPWITISGGKVTQLDFAAYLKYLGRLKTPPAFDALDLATPENQLFGNGAVDRRHFTDYGATHGSSGTMRAETVVVKMMNPMDYVGKPGATTATHWRIRHGAKDSDTSLAISLMFATLLRNNGIQVDYALPWAVTHSGDYDLDELTAWIDQICR